MFYFKRLLFAPLLAILALDLALMVLLPPAVQAEQVELAPNPSPVSYSAPLKAELKPANFCLQSESGARLPALQTSSAYSFTSQIPKITEIPVIDGIFSSTPVDFDGTASITEGIKTTTISSFIELKPFDILDNVYFRDTGLLGWEPGLDSLWVDTNGSGVYDPGIDSVIVGPMTGSDTQVDATTSNDFLAYNDVEFERTDSRFDNNQYDDGEDIYLIDDLGEFRGAQHFAVPDPEGVNNFPIAHVYWIQDENYIYFHNDFLVDADTTFFGGGGGTPATAGFIDGDGVGSAGTGSPYRIGFTATTFFSTTDRVAWYDADDDSAWSPTVDALWFDSLSTIPPTYTSATDFVIVYAGGTLTDGVQADAWLTPDTYDFVYHDGEVAYNGQYDSGEDIWALSGDEQWDYNYFDNELNWLIDGDGAATTGRGADEPARYDGNTWFQAADQVYWYDTHGTHYDWNPYKDALWQDVDNNGMYHAVTDTLLFAAGSVPEGTAVDMLLLERIALDSDGDPTTGVGEGSFNAYRAGKMPRLFSAADNVLWLDADDSARWSNGDALWRDGDKDAVFTISPSDTVIITATNLVSGAAGNRLTFAAHWIGYHDGEVTYNGQYDLGEDIYASNTFLNYDDFELTPDHRYTNGEDIYDRDVLEIWVYAEGENITPIGNPEEPAPDYETALRDIGFRVHINGVRIDKTPPITNTRTISDYDSPKGIEAAAGWGPSRGLLGLGLDPLGYSSPTLPVYDPMRGVYNRHYEYRLPRQGTLSSMKIAGDDVILRPSEEIIDIIIWPDCTVEALVRWKDIRRDRGSRSFTGDLATYSTSSGEGWVVLGSFVHPPPPPPPIIVVKSDINELLLADDYGLADSLVDVFFEIDYTSPTSPNRVIVPTEMIGLELVGVKGSHEEIWVTAPPPDATEFEVYNYGDSGWAQMTFSGQQSGDVNVENKVITNIIEVDPSPDPDDEEEDEDEAVWNPTPAPELFKVAFASEIIVPGGVVTYEIIYGNLGVFPLEDVLITDTLPLSTTFEGGLPNGDFAIDSFFDITYQIDPDPLLPAQWGRAQMVISIPLTMPWGTRFTNELTGLFPAPMAGLLTTTVVFSLPLEVTNPTDLSIAKSGPEYATINQPLTYTIVVSNAGSYPSTNVVISDTLPDNVQVGQIEPSPPCALDGRTVNCALDSLSAGGVLTITIVVTPTTTGALTNRAGVQAETPDLTSANDTSVQTSAVGAQAIGVATQPITKHSTLIDKDGKAIRDDEFAGWIEDLLMPGGTSDVRDAKFIFQQCFGGGMLDDLEDALDDHVRWVGGSASKHNECATGQVSTAENDARAHPYDERWVSDPPENYWTRALLDALDALGFSGSLLEAINRAAANDGANDNGVGHLETGQSASGGGGNTITLRDQEAKSHHAILWGGDANRMRHFHNISNTRAALVEHWGEPNGVTVTISIMFGDGARNSDGDNLPAAWNATAATTQNLKAALEALSNTIDSDEQFFFYATDHGGSETVVEAVGGGKTAASNLFSGSFGLWPAELDGMSGQSENQPILAVKYAGSIEGSNVISVTLNGVLLGALDPNSPTTEFQVTEADLGSANTVSIDAASASAVTIEEVVFFTGGIDTNPPGGLTGETDLSVDKARDGSGNVTAGDQITYTITINNSGPSKPDVQVIDTWSPVTAVVGVDAPGGCDTTNWSAGVITCTRLAFGTGSLLFPDYLIFTTSDTFSGALVNTAAITATITVTDPNSANNIDTVSVNVIIIIDQYTIYLPLIMK